MKIEFPTISLVAHCSNCNALVTLRNDTAARLAWKGILCSSCLRSQGKQRYTDYLKTPHWQQTRQQALKRAGHKCQLCGATNELDTHHNSYDRLGRELDTDLVVLCRTCHKKFHGK